MPESLLNKIHNFPEAKAILAEQIRTFAAEASKRTGPAPVLKRFEIRVEKMDLLAWLSQQRSATKIFGSDQSENYAIAGIGEADVITGAGPVNHEMIDQKIRPCLPPQYPYLRYYGGFSFDPLNPGTEWDDFGTYRFLIPRFELATKEGKYLLACTVLLKSADPGTWEKILKELETLTYANYNFVVQPLEMVIREDDPDRQGWEDMIGTILASIRTDECRKIVLARKTRFTFDKPLDPWLLFRQLKNVSPSSYHFCFQFNGGPVFLGASPERLFKRTGRAIQSEAVAGTRSRGASHEKDGFLRQDLLASAKDQREHQFVVEAIQSHLGAVCNGTVQNAGTNILSLESGHHLITCLQGQLKETVKDWQILDRLHPTPAVGGVPKEKAMEIIRSAEPFSRGWYAAPVGYIGNDQTEFVVAIRSALVRGSELVVYAGAGIVEGSVPGQEWEEVENKIGNFLKVLHY
ncbi:MAG: isochorismate synthase [Candidatus Omnitrophota bacterium]|nr:isochorismate synthase [Candidatus Omnitrophota bacterium]MDZ4241987.1 isochorismate synthase [Candidatus Omnitrophota bacterium]